MVAQERLEDWQGRSDQLRFYSQKLFGCRKGTYTLESSLEKLVKGTQIAFGELLKLRELLSHILVVFTTHFYSDLYIAVTVTEEVV